MAAGNFKQDNLTAIIDCNKFQLSGPTDEVMSLGDLPAKLKAFGWEVARVYGHDVEALCKALARDDQRTAPLAVVMDTVKGKGLSFAENDNAWHHAVVTQKFYEQGLRELGYGE